MQSMSLGRGRGRPRKDLVEPSLDGYPADGTEEEKKQWLCMKCMEQWRYNILTSNKAEEYREKEKAWCSMLKRGKESSQHQVQQLKPLT